MHHRKITLAVLGLLLTSAFVALAPTASAQVGGMTVTMTITPPSEPVKPLQGAINFNGQTTVQGSNDAPVTNLIGFTLAYTVASQPSWASVTVSPATDTFLVQAGPSNSFTQTRSFIVTVSATQDAPAFTPTPIEISVLVTPSQQAGATAKSAKAPAPVQAAYFSIIDLLLQETIRVERPQTAVNFPLKVTNLGNANTKVNFAITDRTPNLQVPIPGSIILQSKQAGGNQISQDVLLPVQTPYKNGYMNVVGVVSYKVTSNYALDAKIKGDEGSVSVVVTTKGFYVPGMEPVFALAAVGAVALLMRRRL